MSSQHHYCNQGQVLSVYLFAVYYDELAAHFGLTKAGSNNFWCVNLAFVHLQYYLGVYLLYQTYDLVHPKKYLRDRLILFF